MIDDLLWHIDTHTFPAAFGLLPGSMASPEARAMLLAIGLQESGFRYRRQLPNGPARGFWQFEMSGGVAEILTTPATKPIIEPIVAMFRFVPSPAACHEAIQNHDVLAACFARLLLWVDPRPMPSALEAEKGWQIYLRNWRPGKPHPATWAGNFDRAWQVVRGGELL